MNSFDVAMKDQRWTKQIPISTWLLHVFTVPAVAKTSTVVYPVPQYFLTLNTVDAIFSTPYLTEKLNDKKTVPGWLILFINKFEDKIVHLIVVTCDTRAPKKYMPCFF